MTLLWTALEHRLVEQKYPVTPGGNSFPTEQPTETTKLKSVTE
jgi:hypothetical protein